MTSDGAPTRRPGDGALPPLFEYAAPAAWRAIDLIADLHLCAAVPRTFDAWAAHMRQTTADAVFILGDLFEAWVGDDLRQRPFEAGCVDVMAEASTRLHVAIMVGNRDFLLGADTLRAAGASALPDPTVLSAWGHRVLLSHGDALCLDDAPYQAFRVQVRSPAWQRDFLARPLAERLRLAAQMRQASRSTRKGDAADSRFIDLDPAETVRWLHTTGVAEMVHGHTHRPGSDMLAPGYKRHVLSDWDLDHGERAEVLRLTRDGFARLPPAGSLRSVVQAGAPAPRH